MSTTYPGAKQTFTNPVNGDIVEAALIGDIADTVEAIQDVAGASPCYYPTGALTTIDRLMATSSLTLSSQNPYITGFIAEHTKTVSTVSVYNVTGTGTATSAYVGIYTLASNGDATLVASSASLTSWFASTGVRSISLSASYTLQAGVAYGLYIMHNGAFSPQLAASPVLAATALGQNIKQPYVLTRCPTTTSAPAASLVYSGQTAISGGCFYAELT